MGCRRRLPDNAGCHFMFFPASPSDTCRWDHHRLPATLLHSTNTSHAFQAPKLVLLKIKGPTNADFTEFLNVVASSLTELRLHECWFEKASSSEELALDASMSKMNLKKASVNTHHISILALSRNNDMGLPRVSRLFVRSVPHGSGDQSSVIDDIVNFSVKGHGTSWQLVSVLCYTAELTHSESLVDTSIAAATLTGTTLVFQISSNGW